MSAKSRNKQLRITMFLNTPTPTNSRKRDGNTPMTRKRRRELEAELEAGNDSSGVDSVEVDTPVRPGKRAKRSSNVTSKQTPPGKGKPRVQQTDADSDEEGKRAGPSNPPKHRAVKAVRKAGNLLTPEHEGVDPPEDSSLSSLKTPFAELKLGGRSTSTESPPPHNTRRGLRSSNVGLPTPIPSASKSKADNRSKGSVKKVTGPLEDEPIIISSSPLSPLTDLPDPSDSPPRPQSPVQNPSPIFKVPALPLQTPRRNRVEKGRPGLNPARQSAMAVDFDEGVVPTSQSQDLRPFVISPPRPGGTALFKDTTPKSLRQSQGYVDQPSQPLPSVLATIQAGGHSGTQETDVVPTSQMEETELRIPRSAQAGSSRALAFSSPSPKRDKAVPGHNDLPSAERTGVFRTPTKVTGRPLDGTTNVASPIVGLLHFPKRNSPTRGKDDRPSTSPLPPSSLPPPASTHGSSRDDIALDFVQYQTTPTKRRSSLDSSPRKELKLFESQMTLSPTWSQPRSFERWRLRDLLDSQRAFGDGKAGLEAEAEGHEPGGGTGTDGEESEESEKAAMMASSITEAESQDFTEWFLRTHPELKYAGKAPPYKSGSSSLRSSKSGSDSTKNKNDGNENGSGSRVEQVGIIVIDDTPPTSQNSKKSDNSDFIKNRIENVGMVSPVSSLTESDSQISAGLKKAQDDGESQDVSGLGESALAFSQPTLDPLMAFLDIFDGGSSVPQDSQSPVIDIDD